MAGKVVSSTVTTKLQPLLLPLESIATQFTAALPREKNEPDGGVQATGTFMSQLSVAVALKTACAPVVPAQASVWLEGHWIVGGVVSRTVTTNVQPLLLPLPSMA